MPFIQMPVSQMLASERPAIQMHRSQILVVPSACQQNACQQNACQQNACQQMSFSQIPIDHMPVGQMPVD